MRIVSTGILICVINTILEQRGELVAMSFLDNKVSSGHNLCVPVNCTLKSLNYLYQKSTIMTTEVKQMHTHVCVFLQIKTVKISRHEVLMLKMYS